MSNPPAPSSNKKTLILAGIGALGCLGVIVVLALAGGGYWWYTMAEQKRIAAIQERYARERAQREAESAPRPAPAPARDPVPAPAPAPVQGQGTRVAFVNGQHSMVLPAGWTSKADGKVLKVTGPGGVSLDALAVRTQKGLDEFIKDYLAIQEKTAGYKLLDTDSVQTNRGALGKLAFYQRSGTAGNIVEVAIAFQRAGEITFLGFSMPASAAKASMTPINSIYTSLEIP